MSDTLFSSSDGIDPEIVETARAELAAKLPELRKLPGFPIGSDEDILKMSVPPYYTACPNPFIEDWLEASAPDGYEDREYVDSGPFASDVSAGKTHPIYRAHAYWTKVPHELIMRYILHYTKPGDVVLDGFAGSGMTGVAAQACGIPEERTRTAIGSEIEDVVWGARRAILQDLSPIASFISAGLNLPIDATAFDVESQSILDELEAELGWLFQTSHSDGSKAAIDFTVWSEVFTCPNCGSEVVFFSTAFDDSTGKVRRVFACDSCGSDLEKKDLLRKMSADRDPDGGFSDRIVTRPVEIHYRVGKARFTKVPDDDDLKVIRDASSIALSWFPDIEFPLDDMYHGSRLGPKGFWKVSHLWGIRSLAAVSLMWRRAVLARDGRLRHALLFWIEQAMWTMSRMNSYRPAGYSQNSQYPKGFYYVPSLHSEVSLDYCLGRRKRSDLKKMWSQSPAVANGVRIGTGSSSLLLLPDSCVDYVFVDPPFGANIPYADLDIPWEAWHRVMTEVSSEAITDSRRRKDVSRYRQMILDCFVEFHRVLKPGRWMTVVFSNSSNEVWLAIQEALSNAGFVLADTRVMDKQQGSYRQVTARNIVKRDLVLSAYRPSSETEERFALVAGKPEGAWAFVSEHLSHLPVVEGRRGEGALVRERFADRLYDRMVAYHVHRSVSVPLTAAEFYSGLEQRFPVRDDMYFLPEQVEEYERHRMTFKDLAQLEMFITGEASAVQWLRQLLKKKPRTYAQIQPLFFDELQAGLPDWEELPELRELLEESFLQDDQDRWFVPDPKKSVDLEAQRTKGLLREFEGYVSGKGKLSSFRSEAVRAGFKDAWGRRDFGKLISVGERLPADAFVEDEALLYYYDNARRLLPEAE